MGCLILSWSILSISSVILTRLGSAKTVIDYWIQSQYDDLGNFPILHVRNQSKWIIESFIRCETSSQGSQFKNNVALYLEVYSCFSFDGCHTNAWNQRIYRLKLDLLKCINMSYYRCCHYVMVSSDLNEWTTPLLLPTSSSKLWCIWYMLAYRAAKGAISQRPLWSLALVKALLSGGMSSPLKLGQQSHCPSHAIGKKSTISDYNRF